MSENAPEPLTGAAGLPVPVMLKEPAAESVELGVLVPVREMEPVALAAA